MALPIAEMVAKWDLEGHTTSTGEQFTQVHERLLFLQRQHYDQYVPTQGSQHADYETRLENWLANVTDDKDKRLLFELAPQIAFFGKDDMLKLHQAALRGPITRWLMDLNNFDFATPSLEQKLEDEIHKHTWYCPISDSMQISEFHHANNIGGIDYRPDWRSLACFGDPTKIAAFMVTLSTRLTQRKIATASKGESFT